MGGAVLVASAAVAMVWANSPWSAGYDSFVTTDVSLHVGSFTFDENLTDFVNEGLMALFFLVIALEIKRELVVGELRHWRSAALPVVAAAGGMVVPALIYAAVNAGDQGSRGWGIPMATDIAFALGVVALLGRRVPSSLKVFLLTLATVDDVGAIVVIAAFYSGGVDSTGLLAAAAVLTAVAGLRWLRVPWWPVYVVLGVVLWVAVRQAGIHPTIAGVVMGLMAPARPVGPASVPVVERIEHLLHPFVSFLVVPLFALVNAGVALDGDALDAPGAAGVAAGVVLGLLVGKMAGIIGFSGLAVGLGVGSLPPGVTWRQLSAVSAVGAVGFTVALFIAELAFDQPALENAAKLGILVASALAAVLGAALLAWSCRAARPQGSAPGR